MKIHRRNPPPFESQLSVMNTKGPTRERRRRRSYTLSGPTARERRTHFFSISNLHSLLLLFLVFYEFRQVSGLGSMSSLAVSYGENGPSLCGLNADGSHLVSCYGSDTSVVYGAPFRIPFSGLTAGDGFVCGLLMESKQPYCWGNNVYIQMGVPQPTAPMASYSEISAGDHHLCALRENPSHVLNGSSISSFQSFESLNLSFSYRLERSSIVDCWGYNMTATHDIQGDLRSITAGSVFNCGLFRENKTAFCWGDETGKGRFHVCGVLMASLSRVLCWGRSLSLDNARDKVVSCWDFKLDTNTLAPANIRVLALAAGDYFTCGVLAYSHPGICYSEKTCSTGFYAFRHENSDIDLCKPNKLCLPCSHGCPSGMYQSFPCTEASDRRCGFNCSICSSPECFSACSFQIHERNRALLSLKSPVFFIELAIAVVLVSIVSLLAVAYVRIKLQRCNCSAIEPKTNTKTCSFRKESIKISPDLDELKIRRAQAFSYEELERATGGFKEESIVGKGSFSSVFKGVLKDGTVVAVKRAIMASDVKKNSKEFHTELDLLSRLNHAHLLNLLGYCEEGGERLLVYEYMAHGSLHEHLHGNRKEPLNWVRRVTIAVQAARGIEYLHGYACPPVIHRDIKSSNILIDEEFNARVADFGLSLLGPADSNSPLSELPAGTLGYLDPEYYRLHYLTTKSDVYSFGVLLLELISGRKAIDMKFEDGNIVEWAVPLIKAGNLNAILDPNLRPPVEMEAMRRIANIASRCVRMRGRERPSMEKVTTGLERALALLMGSPCNEQPILPSEVVLGSSRLHKKASQRSSNRSGSSETIDNEDQRFEFRAPSWITFPSVTSSQRRKSSGSDGDGDGKNCSEVRDGLRCLDEEEIAPASPQQELFLQHNF
ncbi:hypothetical protein AMTRI_Chr06g177760 [Amborella trichopoda]